MTFAADAVRPPDFDVDAIRVCFPALRSGTAFFDGPGGSQTPDVVADAMRDAMLRPLSNRGTNTDSERNAEAIVHDFRRSMGQLLNADPRGVIFGRSMTALTFDLARAISATWRPGDEIVVSRLDHDANIRPWVIAAARADVTVRWAEFDPDTAELPAENVAAQLTERTRLVAVTAASNLIGTMPDVRSIAADAHAAGALVYVDGVHYTAHSVVDVVDLGADFFACSPYKFLGPHCGVVAGRPELLEGLHPDKLKPSTDQIPERFELGTLPYEVMAGASAAVGFLAGLSSLDGDRRARLVSSMTALARHEDQLRVVTENELRRLPGATIHSRAAHRTPTLLVTFDGHRCADLSARLAAERINAPAGSFYAYEAARRLGLPEGGLRIGMSPYNTIEDVDRLLATLTGCLGS